MRPLTKRKQRVDVQQSPEIHVAVHPLPMFTDPLTSTSLALAPLLLVLEPYEIMNVVGVCNRNNTDWFLLAPCPLASTSRHLLPPGEIFWPSLAGEFPGPLITTVGSGRWMGHRLIAEGPNQDETLELHLQSTHQGRGKGLELDLGTCSKTPETPPLLGIGRTARSLNSPMSCRCYTLSSRHKFPLLRALVASPNGDHILDHKQTKTSIGNGKSGDF